MPLNTITAQIKVHDMVGYNGDAITLPVVQTPHRIKVTDALPGMVTLNGMINHVTRIGDHAHVEMCNRDEPYVVRADSFIDVYCRVADPIRH